MTSMQSDPVFFNCVKTEHSLVHCKLYPREELFQVLFCGWVFCLLEGFQVLGGLGFFYVFRLHDLPVVSTVNGFFEQDGFAWSCQISHLCKNLF